MYKELIEKSIKNRNKIVFASDIPKLHRPYEAYASMFSMDKGIEEFVKIQKTVSGYNGKYFAEFLLFDIDAENLQSAQASAVDLIKHLNKNFGVSPYQCYIWFSGSKGFHIGLSQNLFGGFMGSTDLPDKVKILAGNLSKDIPHVDLKIYNKNRIFRLTNSVNLKSNLYKVQLSWEELLGKDIVWIKTQAKAPSDIQAVKTSTDSIHQLVQAWQDAQKQEAEQMQAPMQRNDSNGEVGFFAPPREGERNQTLFKQSALLLDKGISESGVFDIMQSINFASGNPVSASEMNTIISSASRKTASNEKPKNEEVRLIDIGEALKTWEDYIMDDSTPLSLGFDKIDKDMRGKYRGKVGTIIGYGGSKKSLLGLQSALKNLRNGVAIYSNMEMSLPQFTERIIDYVTEVDSTNASVSLEKYYHQDINAARAVVHKQLIPYVGKNLQILQKGRMTTEEYDKAIELCKSDIGEPAMLVIDGLSMMGGANNETERYSVNTADLKELANKHNILILLIAHCSKGATKYQRDISGFVRGSEKILDNTDFYIMMSQIIDAPNSTLNAVEYRKDVGYVRFVNKRGTGNVISSIYKFIPTRLKLEETNIPPYSYEVNLTDLSAVASVPVGADLIDDDEPPF